MASPFDAQYDQIRSRIEYYANLYGIDPNVAIWQLWQENKFRSSGCSGAGACGIAQFIPATASRFGVDRNDIESSLNGWGRYMRQMLDQFNGRIDLALAGYNSGENRSEYRNAASENRPINWSVLPSGVQSETQNYVNYIMQNAGASPLTASGVGSVASSFLGGNTVYYLAGLLLLVLLIDD